LAVKVAVKKPRIAEIRITDCTSTLGLMLVWRGREGGRGRLQRQAQVSGAAGQGSVKDDNQDHPKHHPKHHPDGQQSTQHSS